jgi:two-component system KDP operon response regulator KdpE
VAEKILVVEDNQVMRRSLVRLLEAESYEVAEAANGEEGLAQFARVSPDLIIMDVNMPKMDGLQALQRLREFSRVPVLILSVRGTERDKVTGLDIGADDYLPKPFGADELLARLRALLRRRPQGEQGQQVLRLGGGELVIDLAEHRVLVNGQLLHLTPVESRLLFALAEHAGQVISTEDLKHEVWGDDPSGTTQNLKLYVLYVRRKIEPDPAQPRYLLTVRGSGYTLAGL